MSLQNLRLKISQSPLLKRFVVGTSWLLGGGLVSVILNAISTFALAAYLGVEEYGLIALTISTVTLITGLLTLRTIEATTKYLIEFIEEKAYDKAAVLVKFSLVVDLAVALLASVVLYVGAVWIVPFVYGDVAVLPWFKLFAITPVLVFCYATSTAVLRAGDKFSVITGVEVFHNALKVIGVVILIVAEATWQQILIWLVIVIAARGLALLASVYYGCKTLALNLQPSWGFKPIQQEFKGIWQLMFTTSGVFMVKTAHMQLDTVIVGTVLGPAASGAYKLARNMIQLLAFPTNALFQVSFPEFARLLKQGEKQRLMLVMRNLMLATLGLCAIYCLGMWFVAPYVLPLIIGPSYDAGIALLPILVIGLSLVILSQYWHAALVAVNRAGQVALSMSAGLVVQVLILLALLQAYGLVVAAIAYVAYCVTRAVLLYLRFKRFVITEH